MSNRRNSFKQLGFADAQNFRRAVLLNSPCTLSQLRSLYAAVLAGQQFGLRSGYSP